MLLRFSPSPQFFIVPQHAQQYSNFVFSGFPNGNSPVLGVEAAWLCLEVLWLIRFSVPLTIQSNLTSLQIIQKINETSRNLTPPYTSYL